MREIKEERTDRVGSKTPQTALKATKIRVALVAFSRLARDLLNDRSQHRRSEEGNGGPATLADRKRLEWR